MRMTTSISLFVYANHLCNATAEPTGSHSMHLQLLFCLEKEAAKPLLSHLAVARYSFTVSLYRATHHLEDAEVSGRCPSKGCELKIIGVVNFTSLSVELSFRPSMK